MRPNDRVDVDLELLDRYLAGEGNADESAQVSAWLASHSAAAAWLGGVVEGLSSDPTLPDAELSDTALSARVEGSLHGLLENLSESTGQSETPTAVHVHRTPFGKFTTVHGRRHTTAYVGRRTSTPKAAWYAVAGVLVGIVMMLAIDHSILDRWITPRSGAMTEYVTQPGQRARITLPDGSVGILNVASRIDVPVGFGSRTRTIKLTGQAYFEVAHSNKTPFIVDAAGVRTQVLGTAFSVRAYRPTDVRVAVQSGRVAVGGAVVNASDIAFASGTTVRVAHHQRLDTELGFVTGRLVLANIPLRDAVTDLDRWYGAEIRFGDPAIGDMLIDATLMSGSIGDLMEMLRATFNVRVVRTGRTLTLYPSHSPTGHSARVTARHP
jgi:ferric-dicitrate binding protein FerR (iron transport regulator)